MLKGHDILNAIVPTVARTAEHIQALGSIPARY